VAVFTRLSGDKTGALVIGESIKFVREHQRRRKGTPTAIKKCSIFVRSFSTNNSSKKTIIMKKNILMLITGLSIGVILMSFIGKKKEEEQQTKYIELKEDFSLHNGSVLKKGTMLKVDKSASEGYTRYILYVNYKSGEGIEPKAFEKENLIKPYWLYRIDSLTIKN
jgi:cbb3-type cytochrome oxidase subunit 3